MTRWLARLSLSLGLLVAAGCHSASSEQASLHTPARKAAITTNPVAAGHFHAPQLQLHAVRVYSGRLRMPTHPLEGLVETRGGIRYLVGTRRYLHPVAAEEYGIGLLEAYSKTHDRRQLRTAITQAHALLRTAHRSSNALFFAYPFRFDLNGNVNDPMTPPWYSAMAQGEGLALFVHLWLATHDAKWHRLLQPVFDSFFVQRTKKLPWAAFVDRGGWLWLEEYAKDPPGLVLNGHLFAAFGIYQYWRLTHDPRAKRLIDGAFATIRHYFPRLRVPGDLSHYGLRLGAQDINYHRVHIAQMLTVYRLTGDRWWLHAAHLLEQDLKEYQRRNPSAG